MSKEGRSFVFDPTEGALTPFQKPVEPTPPATPPVVEPPEGVPPEPVVTEPPETPEVTPPVATVVTEPPQPPEKPEEEEEEEEVIETVEEPETPPATEEEEEGEEGEPSIDNFFYASAKQMQEDGELPADLEIPEDITPQQVYSTYKESLRADVTRSVLTEVMTTLQQEGYTRENLETARMLNQGIDIDSIADGSDYKQLSELDLEALDPEDKIDLLETYYEENHYHEDDIKSLVKTAKNEGTLDSLAETAKEFFGKKYLEVSEQQKQQAEIHRQRQEQLATYNASVINDFRSNRQLYGEKLDDTQYSQFEQALSTPSVPIQTPQGVQNVTPFQMFMDKIGNDLQFQLYAFKRFLFAGQETQAMREEIEKEVEDNYLSRWGTSKQPAKKKKKTKPKGTVIKAKPPSEGSTYVYDGESLHQL